MQAQLSLAQLAARCGGDIVGDANTLITGVASLVSAQTGDLSFFADTSVQVLANTAASAVILSKDDRYIERVPATVAKWLVAGAPRTFFAHAIEQLYPPLPPTVSGISSAANIHPQADIAAEVAIDAGAVVAADAQIGNGCTLHAGVVVGQGCKIAADCVLHPRVVLYPGVTLGAGCILHAGVVIGADGFGYTDNNAGRIDKVRQLGSVRIGNYVEIGANSAIDCGTLDDTIIGDHVKIDNLVQIGHNVIIGEGSIICGQTGIAGSCRIGKYCVLGGKVGVIDHVEIGDRVRVAGASNVTHHIKSGETISSMLPAMPIRHWRRLLVTLRRQPAAAKTK